MASDARISTALPQHPKLKKLQRRLGPAGCWSLVCLLLWAAANRPDGDLRGLDAEDIEVAGEWGGKPGTFTRSIREVGFIEGHAGAWKIHHWSDHQPWAAARGQRIAAARAAAKIRWGKRTECAAHADGCDSHEGACTPMPDAQNCSAPNPTQPNLTQTNTDCAAAPADAVTILLPLNTGKSFAISENQAAEWQRLYGAVDVVAELRKMRGWLLANPTRRKTSRGVLRFANAWLSREQDRGAVTPVDLAKSQGMPSATPEAAPSDPLPAGLTGQDEAEAAWKAIQAKAEGTINRHSFETWLKPCRGLGLVGRDLFVRVPTPEFRIVGEKFGSRLRMIAAELGLTDLHFIFREAMQ